MELRAIPHPISSEDDGGIVRGSPLVIDLLTDDFPLIQGEAEWVVDLLGSDLARCLE